MTGAVKWGDLGIGVHYKYLSELEVLADAGHAWAREALEPSAPFLYVTGGKFSENFSTRASEEGHSTMASTLRDLYEGAHRVASA